jgi:hypothetical protein
VRGIIFSTAAAIHLHMITIEFTIATNNAHHRHAALDAASRFDTAKGEFWMPHQVRHDE